MRKWKIFYPLMQSKKISEEEAGITLVELLAAISILSIVILLAGSVHMFGQRQFIDQTKAASQANDLSYAMTVMSKDLRKKPPNETVEVSQTKITLSDGLTYEIIDSTLKRNNITIVDGVTGIFSEINNSEGVHVQLESASNARPSKKYETTIYFRGLPDD